MWEAKRLRVTHVPAYPRVLQLAKERRDAILLEVGCCCKCRGLYQSIMCLRRVLSRKRPPKDGSRWLGCEESNRV